MFNNNENHSAELSQQEKVKQDAYQGLAKSIAFHAGIKIAIILAVRLVQKRMKKNVAKHFNSNL